MAYNQLLKYHGLKDHQVNKTALGGRRTVGLFLYRLLLLLTWSTLGLPGFILNLPVVVVARVIASKKAKEAVQASSVKVAGRDVLATWKLLVALVFIPILYGFYAMIVLLVSFKYNWTTKWKILGPTLSFLLMMVGSYATIRLVDTGFNIYKSLRPLFLSLFPGSRTKIQNLRVVREQLSQDLTELINELGPKIYEDFDAERIIQANRSQLSPNSNSNTSIFHSPIDWLDNQVFNWETVANSEYDDVFFFLDKQNGSVTGRSRTSSWAASGQSSRSRSRTSSFGAGPSGESFRVEAMTELPRDKPFSEVTRVGSIPRLEVKDMDEDLGYQGDREDEESKKTV